MDKKTLILILFLLALFSGCSSINSITIDKVDVAIQDQTTEVIDLFLTRYISDITLTKSYEIDDNYINFTSSVAPVQGNMICLKENDHFYQGEITSVSSLGGNTYQVRLDSPLDYDYTILGSCSLRSKSLAVDGSVTPVIFEVSPSNLNVSWDINYIVFHIQDNVAIDSDTFGGLTKLTNGIVLRNVDGITKNIANYKYTSDFRHHNFYADYDDRAPAGQFGFSSMKIFNGQANSGVVIRLDSATNDTLQIIVQDDLTGLTAFHVIAHGQVVED